MWQFNWLSVVHIGKVKMLILPNTCFYLPRSAERTKVFFRGLRKKKLPWAEIVLQPSWLTREATKISFVPFTLPTRASTETKTSKLELKKERILWETIQDILWFHYVLYILDFLMMKRWNDILWKIRLMQVRQLRWPHILTIGG